MTLLNSGDYYNRTGSYATSGLTTYAKSQIADAKWYLGGTANFYSTSDGLASNFYNHERGTTVYSGRPTSWIGKVGLIYPSDYGYATDGGSTTNRDGCLEKIMYNWSSEFLCRHHDWLYDSSDNQWTLTLFSDSSRSAFSVNSTGGVSNNNAVGNRFGLRPTVFLKANIKITGGNGSSATPYEISG